MTQEELNAIYEDCKDFDDHWDEFEMRVEDLGGRVFFNDWQGHTHMSIHVEKDMLEYMKECGFEIFEHPEYLMDENCGRKEYDHWVVFPPKK